MGKGLSQLQRAILEILAERARPYDLGGGELFLGDCARSSEIITALGRDRTPANRAAVSKALDRLVRRGLVERGFSWLAIQGRGGRYWLAEKPPPEGEG